MKVMRSGLLAWSCLLFLAACEGGTPVNAPSPGPTAGPAIQNVVVIMQENRTFDGMFQGYPGANTVSSGMDHLGVSHTLQPVSLAYPYDINHLRLQFLENYDGGKMDGFDEVITGFKGLLDPTQCPPDGDYLNRQNCWIINNPAPPMPNPGTPIAYSYVPRSESEPLWSMAAQYALGDNFFPSNNGPSYVSHQFMISGQAGHVAEIPSDFNGTWGCDAPANTTTAVMARFTPPPSFPVDFGIEVPGPFPCFSYPTAADILDASKVSWKYYAPTIGLNLGDIWSAFDVIRPVRFGADWARNVSAPETNIFNDIQNGTLPQVSWVNPSFVNSDHAGSRSTSGPQWVASIVNAVGTSKYWQHTAIIVMYDDWGGWYDHVAPPQYLDPVSNTYEGLGIRTPLIVISPYSKHGYVSHTQHEVASSLHFIEKMFNLGSLGVADARADALDDMFDFTQQPSTFKTISARMRKEDFLKQKPSVEAPDY